MTRPSFIFLVCLLCASGARAEADSENWFRYRGPQGTGDSAQASLPVSWNEKSIVWKTPLKGRGQSSPVFWGDRIFLTSALEDGKQRLIIAVDARTGKILWEKIAWTGAPERSHDMNGWASATCVTDGEHVYCFFGKAGAHCYTVDGKHVWSRDLGAFESGTHRGTAASPMLEGDLLIINGDSESDHALFGLNKLTGETVWKTDRPPWEGYSTPVMVEVGGKQEIILNGERFVAGYDPATGKQLWTCKSFAGRGEPLPAFGNGVLYVVNGLAGDFYAVRPGGSGDVTSTHMVWHTPRRGNRDGPSPIFVNGFLLVSDMSGIATCYDSKTGKELWKKRLGGKISSSPFAAAGKAYFLFENGETAVIEPGPELKEISHNVIGAADNEIFRASPVPCHGRILLRSDRVLYCVGASEADSKPLPK